MRIFSFSLPLCVLVASSLAQPEAPAPKVRRPEEPQRPPTLGDVRYGPHQSQVLDFWRMDSAKPAPLLFHIHGGGWTSGDKARVADLERYLTAGISVVSINYRFVMDAVVAGVKPPLRWPFEDITRALQFTRSKSVEWNIDKTRVAATGSSAGACASLWLAFHADMADVKSSDPVARETTRLSCAAVVDAQTTLDPAQMKEWTPNSRYGGHAFGFMTLPPDYTVPLDRKIRDAQFAQFLAARESILPWIREYSPFEHVTSDDPPIYMIYTEDTPTMGQALLDPTHTANFGVKLQEKLRSVGVPNELVHAGAPDVRHSAVHDFVIESLRRP